MTPRLNLVKSPSSPRAKISDSADMQEGTILLGTGIALGASALLTYLTLPSPLLVALALAGLAGTIASVVLRRYGLNWVKSQIALLIFANLLIFVASFLDHPNGHTSWFLIPFIGAPFMMFQLREQQATVLWLTALPVILLLVLVSGNYADLRYVDVNPEVATPIGNIRIVIVVLTLIWQFAVLRWVTAEFSGALYHSLKTEETSNKVKTAFLNSMSHEVRTPMAAVVGAAELISDHPQADDEIKELAGMILHGGRSILAISDKSTLYSKLTSGETQVHVVSMDPLFMVHKVANEFAPDIAQKGLDFSIKANLTARIVADPDLFREAFTQLLDNAIKFAPNKGRVQVALTRGEPGHLMLSLTDNGPGIPHMMFNEAFEPFNRLRASFGTISGSGVGLSIAKAYTEAQGGFIGLCTLPIKGTRVWMEYPIYVKTDREAA